MTVSATGGAALGVVAAVPGPPLGQYVAANATIITKRATTIHIAIDELFGGGLFIAFGRLKSLVMIFHLLTEERLKPR